jgi:hypothetical protein
MRRCDNIKIDVEESNVNNLFYIAMIGWIN